MATQNNAKAKQKKGNSRAVLVRVVAIVCAILLFGSVIVAAFLM